MTEVAKKWIREQARFRGIFDPTEDGELYEGGRFRDCVPLSSAPSYEACRGYIEEALASGLDGGQVRCLEEELAEYMGLRYAVALSSGQAALQLALKLAAEKVYGSSSGIATPDGMGRGGCLQGRRVFCSDLTTADMVNPIVMEGGEPVLIDSGDTYWSMDPEVLSLAFESYPEVKLVVLSEPYGFPGDILGIRQVCFAHDALLIECVGDSLGASYRIGEGEQAVWGKAGTLGDYCVLDFGEGRLLGGKGGALLVRDLYDAKKARYWASGARAATPWMQHEELGYNYRLGDLDAAVLRGGLAHIDELLDQKKAIYERYREKLDGALACLISAPEDVTPSYWMCAMTSESNLVFRETRNDRKYTYECLHGTAAPMEIYDVLQAFHIECAPVYKPMSMQPIYRNNEHFTLDGAWRRYADLYNDNYSLRSDRAKEYYECGIVLPSPPGLSAEAQDKVIELIYACYDKAELDRLAWE